MIALGLVLAGLTVVVLALLLLPLLHGWRVPTERPQYDRAVYQAQLEELDRDVARGLISGPDLAAARLEIERRLLHAADAAPKVKARLGSSRALAIATALIVAGGAGSAYLMLGAPGVPDVPFAERHEAMAGQQQAHTDMAEAMAGLIAKLKANPNDAQGWLLLARTQATMSNWQASVDAYSRAIALGQTSPEVMSGYGEMLVMEAGGVVGPPARAAFAKALEGDSKDQVARYYLALADAQAGETRRAIDAWVALAAELPEGSPMRDAVSHEVADAAKAVGIAAPTLPQGPPAAAPAPQTAGGTGPDADQLAAAAGMSSADRDKMIRSMVAQLAASLATAPDNLDGWLRLGRAYAVLGETDKAADAYDHAAKLKPGDVDIPLQEVSALLQNVKPEDPIPARAVAVLKQIAAVSPDRPEVLWYLGMVAARAGQREEAKRNWQHLLTLLPADGEDHKMVAAALKQIEQP